MRRTVFVAGDNRALLESFGEVFILLLFFSNSFDTKCNRPFVELIVDRLSDAYNLLTCSSAKVLCKFKVTKKKHTNLSLA